MMLVRSDRHRARRRRSSPLLDLLGLVAVPLVLASCRADLITQATGTRSTKAVVRAVPVAITFAPLGVHLEVRLDAPSGVQVDYWADSTDRLRMTASKDSTLKTITLLRLRANRTYHYEVRSVVDDGSLGPVSSGTFDTPPLPPELVGQQFVTVGTPSYGVTMFEIVGAFTGFVGVDHDGEVVWWYRTEGAPHGFTRRANGDLVLNDYPNGLREVAPDGTIVRAISAADLGGAPHHDVIATPSNTLLFLQQETRDFDGGPLVADRIVKWDPEGGTVTPRWLVHDHYSPYVSWGTHSGRNDWTHANSLAIGPHGNVILSLNWLDQVVSIAPGWATTEWTLGGVGSSYVVDSAARFMGQHTVQMLSESRVLLFDNGRDRANGDLHSRALEIALDTIAHRASLAWQFHATPEIEAPYVGSVRRLPNGNTVVEFGLSAGLFGMATGPIVAYEVAGSGRALASIVVPDVVTSYRGEPLASIGGERAVPWP